MNQTAAAPAPPELCRLNARAQRGLIGQREISCTELLEAHLEWIGAVNPVVNAICTLVPERALGDAAALDQRLAAGDPMGPLAGLPIAIKDLVNTEGIRTTHGSPLFAEHVPTRDALHVARLKAADAVLVGKTNVPEWGAGSQTFNTLFGATVTPYDPTRTAGGSSGGAAAALAARMLPIADGSDLGGSLRNPAAFCNVVGFRPAAGRVPAVERINGWNPLPVLGPMGRSVEDVALLLSVMAGADPRDPLSRQEDPSVFAGSLAWEEAQPRIGWSEDLGFLPVASAVRDVFGQASTGFRSLGCELLDSVPDLRDAPQVFQILRAHDFARRYAGYYENQRELLKDTVQWNTAKGLAQSGAEVAAAEVAHTAIYQRVLRYFEEVDFLVIPSTQVLPFPSNVEWVREIEGVRFEDYLQWMEICSVISLTGCPSISMPCGFSAEGLPVGLQIIGPPGQDLAVLKLARAFEAVRPVAASEPDYSRLVSDD
ncbi:MAG: amidase [Planctomycetota bacterium]|jgi:amidase